jgi:hypothetical protein
MHGTMDLKSMGKKEKNKKKKHHKLQCCTVRGVMACVAHFITYLYNTIFHCKTVEIILIAYINPPDGWNEKH